MKVLIVNTDYQDFLVWLYTQHPGLEERTYEEQLEARHASLFGVADFYSHNLRQLGHEAHDLYANNRCLQFAWMRDFGHAHSKSDSGDLLIARLLGRARRFSSRWPLSYLNRLSRQIPWLADPEHPAWFYEILSRQIRHYRPDVLLNQDVAGIHPGFLKKMKPYIKLLVGQHPAIELRMDPGLRCYDLMISSFPPTLDAFRKHGLPAELNRLGFEPRILGRRPITRKTFDVTLVGSFHRIHRSRVAFVEALLACLDCPERVKVWAPSIDHLPSASPIRRHYVGQAWGHQMYEILGSSKITLNHHGDVPSYANNMRLYEATGVGALLITDWKSNLSEMFAPGTEVVTYHTAQECAGLIKYYLDNDPERVAIAREGQKRTLREHTYLHRMQEFVDVVRKYL